MAYQGITTETGVADSLFQGALKVNSNFSEIYTALGDGNTINRAVNVGTGITGGGNLNSDITISVDNTVVRTSGNQTVGGAKTFTSTVTTQQSFVGNGTIPIGGIIMWSGTIAAIPTGWALCDGNNGTPNLLDRFIVGAGSGYAVASTGGANSVALTTDEMPSHDHGGSTTGDGGHTHAGIRLGASTRADGISGGDNATYVRVSDSAGAGTGAGTNPIIISSTTTSYTAHNHGIGAQGGNAAHENRPPYYALAFIMRTT